MKKVYNFVNMDANESMFFAEELEYVKSRSYDVQYPELLARKLFPISSEVDSGAETMSYETYDHVGEAKLLHSYGSDLPNIEVKGKKTVRKIYSSGLSFGYSIQDVRNARMSGKPLNQRKADACRRQMLVLENKIAFLGDASTDIPPFINNPSITTVTLADGASGFTDWERKTSDEIIEDITNITNSIVDSTNNVEVPDTLILPIKQYGLIATKARATGTDTTILKFVLSTNPYLKTIIPVYELKGAAPVSASYDSQDCMIAYRRDPSKLTLEIPQDVEFMNPQEKALYYEVPVHNRVAGVVIYYPKSIAQANGI